MTEVPGGNDEGGHEGPLLLMRIYLETQADRLDPCGSHH